jgi:hypothetical protein
MIQGLRQQAKIGRRSKIQSSDEEMFAIVLEALRSGNVAETCHAHAMSPTVFYCGKDDVEKGALAALGERAQPIGPMKRRPGALSSWSGR